MLDQKQLTRAKGNKLIGSDGDKIGKIDDIYVDDATGQPQWALVNTGMFGRKSNFVPLNGATSEGDDLQVPYTKDTVKDAPGVDPDGQLSPEEERRLYEHYEMEYDATTANEERVPPADERVATERAEDVTRDETTDVGREGPAGHDTSGPETDRAMTRSEEEMRVGKTRREAGRVRLRKYVDTEEVSETVPVEREEVRIDREPVTEGNVDEAAEGPAISEEEHEVVLEEEEPVVEKRAVPKERVQAEKEVVTDEERVSGEVRKERIEVDEDVR